MQANDLLLRAAHPGEAHAYRRWVIRVAETVARAATGDERLETALERTPEWKLVEATTQAIGIQSGGDGWSNPS